MAANVVENKVTVQGTNDNSIVSKCSMAAAGYFSDPFLKHFVSKKQRRSPLINRGYYVRTKAIDTVLRGFLDVAVPASCKECRKKQFFQRNSSLLRRPLKSAIQNVGTVIISLGAGFDSTFFRLHSKELLQNTSYFEVDFKELVDRKAQIIRANELLLQQAGRIVSEENGIKTKNYKLVGCDLRKTSELEKLLSLAGLDYEIPTLLLSEVVMTYMDPESSSRLIQWAASKFSSAIFLAYEQIHPNDAFGLVMQSHFNSLQSPLLCINTYPTMTTQAKRYTSLGWSNVSVIDMNHFYYNYVPEEEWKKVDEIEPFDEFEEWNLKCSHYSMAVASSNLFSVVLEQLVPVKQTLEKEQSILEKKKLTWRRVKTSCLERFGHSVCRISNNCVLVCGGFGSMNSRHERLKDGVAINFRSSDPFHEVEVQQMDVLSEPRLFHSTTLLSNGRIFIFGGRSSPVKPSKTYLTLTLNENCTPKRNQIENAADICKDGQSSLNRLSCNASNPPDLKQATKKCWCEIAKIESTDLSEDRKVPCPRWRHTANRIRQKDGTERVLIFGGRTENCLALSDCWTFDTQSRTWEKVSIQGKIPVARHSHTMSEWRDKLILVGGLDQNSNPLSLVEVIDPTVCPMFLEDMELKRPLPPRYSHTAHVVGDKLILLGGINPTDHYSPDLVIVDLSSRDWVSYSFSAQDPSRPVMLHNHTSEMIDDSTLMVLGGGGNCFSFGTHLNKDLLTVDLSSIL